MKSTFKSILLGTAFIFSSCKKTNDIINKPVTTQRLEIKLNPQFMPTSKIDSAMAIWEFNGNKQIERMQSSGDTLFVSLEKFVPVNRDLKARRTRRR